jgi:rhamnogalacturonan acetylesterase
MRVRPFYQLIAVAMASLFSSTLGADSLAPSPQDPPRPIVPEVATPAMTRVPGQPVLWLIGDSTVRNSGKGLLGWGAPFAPLLDGKKIQVVNKALGGRSSRSFLREGLWEKVRSQLQPGDTVLMQFGHNDGGPIDREKARASLKGSGTQSQDITIRETGAKETVHSYGWYMCRYASDAKAAGAQAIILSPVPRNMWTGGHVNRSAGDYGKWAHEAADQAGAQFIDLNEIIATRYETEGESKVAADYFTAADHTHTTQAGAAVGAACVLQGLLQLDPARWEPLVAKGGQDQ